MRVVKKIILYSEDEISASRPFYNPDTTSILAPKGQGCPRCGGMVFAAEQQLAKGTVSTYLIISLYSHSWDSATFTAADIPVYSSDVAQEMLQLRGMPPASGFDACLWRSRQGDPLPRLLRQTLWTQRLRLRPRPHSRIHRQWAPSLIVSI